MENGAKKETNTSKERQAVVVECSFRWIVLTWILKSWTQQQDRAWKSEQFETSETNTFYEIEIHATMSATEKKSSLKAWLNSCSELFSSHSVFRDERRIINLNPSFVHRKIVSTDCCCFFFVFDGNSWLEHLAVALLQTKYLVKKELLVTEIKQLKMLQHNAYDDKWIHILCMHVSFSLSIASNYCDLKSPKIRWANALNK